MEKVNYQMNTRRLEGETIITSRLGSRSDSTRNTMNDSIWTQARKELTQTEYAKKHHFGEIIGVHYGNEKHHHDNYKFNHHKNHGHAPTLLRRTGYQQVGAQKAGLNGKAALNGLAKGALTGAAIGTAIPVIGNVVGGVVGGIVGGICGLFS